jgi:release factor glutamine methyltransferase
MHAELTTGRLLEAGLSQLKGRSESPQLDAELLLAFTLGIGRARLKSHPEEEQTAANAERYRLLVERRAAGEPLAYIVGQKDFWTLTLTVTPAVLVPRPETELIVERALALIAPGTPPLSRSAPARTADLHPSARLAAPRGPQSAQASAAHARNVSGARLHACTAVSHQPIRIADLGTGSGAIALALASERPDWDVIATDVSPEALSVARSNASSLGLNNVRFLEGHWLVPLAGLRFNLIASNPPYVAANDDALLAPALRYEPQLALTPGPDALIDLRALIHHAPDHLERGGWLLLEHGSDQAAAVTRELVARGFSHVRSHRDLAGHDRMTEGQWPA